MTQGSSLLRRVACAALPVLLCGCSGAVFDPAGDIAREQRDIILISTALMLLIIVPVMVLIVLFAWRYRKGGEGTYDPQFNHSTQLELAIWSAPLLIIIALGALTWSSTHLLDPFRPLSPKASPADQSAHTPKPAPLVVQVVSLDWKWLFIYPDQGVATVNELAIPINRTVRFDITSSNMMNTFYAPTLAGMIYAMPGMQSQLHAVLRKTGDYDGFSANYSGAGFSDMHFRLKGMDDAGFARWLAEAKKSNKALRLDTYRTLAKPSERVPVTHYGQVEKGLYHRILARCVDPGTTCMNAGMKHEALPDHIMAPPHGNMVPDKPKGAVFKEGNEKGSGPNITAPDAAAKAHGHTQAGDHTRREGSP